MDLMFHAQGWEGQQACWSFRGFHSFRTRLVLLAGVRIEEMQGFGGNRSWKGVPLGGVGELIRHMDDSGILTASVCGRLAPNLHARIGELDPGAPADPSVEYDIQMGAILVKMMEFCAANNVPLEFIAEPRPVVYPDQDHRDHSDHPESRASW